MSKTKTSRRRPSSAMSGTQKMQRTGRTALKRRRDRELREWDLIVEILDSGLVAHVGVCVADQLCVIPMTYGRDGRSLFLHGSVAGRLLRELKRDSQVCVTVTLVDGLLMPQSAFDGSVNYRSVVAFGQAQIVADRKEKSAALRLISEHLVASRWSAALDPRVQAMNPDTLLKFSIDEASAKVRAGPPKDRKGEFKHPVWAGVLPLESTVPDPIPDDDLCEGTPIPAYALHYITQRRAAFRRRGRLKRMSSAKI